jgi:putative DNA methylase
MGERLVAIVADGGRGKVYLPAVPEHEEIAVRSQPLWKPEYELVEKSADQVPLYGMTTYAHLFTPRQLTALSTLSTLIREVRKEIENDALQTGLGVQEAQEYALSVVTFLALALDRCADFNNSLCGWTSGNQKIMHLCGRQAIPMSWDFGEANILGDSVGAWVTCFDYVADCIEKIYGDSIATCSGYALSLDAARSLDFQKELQGDTPRFLVSTDPPYYDNIGYAALSDFFYVWLRRTIGELYPELFSTILVPKDGELVASPERFGGDRRKARVYFEEGFKKAFTNLREIMDPRFPLTVYYAFKQEDEESGEDEEKKGNNGRIDRTTGWETMLTALIETGFQITAT